MPSQPTGEVRPRTISGQALLSGLRPHLKRAFGPTIVAIEDEAVAPYVKALAEAGALLADLAALDGAATWDEATRADLVKRAMSATDLASALLKPGR